MSPEVSRETDGPLPAAIPPITQSDDQIADYLEDVSVPTLVAAVVHLTGDRSFLEGPFRPRTFIPNDFQGGLTDQEMGAARTAALAAIRAYRDAGCPPVAAPSASRVREVMSWLVCEPVTDDYAEMFMEEMNVRGDDPRRLDLTEVAAAARQDLSVVVIGAGQSGLLAGLRLAQAGVPFTILEKNADAGGTWLENSYPGCRVDVGNHFYCYSFEPSHAFSEYFSQAPELLSYFQGVMRRHGLAPHVRWNTEVLSATWDDEASLWRLVARGPGGRENRLDANVVISAVGQLNRPLMPEIPGLAEFSGPAFHTARWDHSVSLAGKRVAVIGAGASGFQIAPAIAGDVESLVVFQRSAQWMAPNRKYRAPVGEGATWAMRHLPGYAAWYRFMLFYQASDKALELVRVDPQWPGMPHSASATSEARRKGLLAWIESQVGDDAELLAKVVPDYPPMGKRLLQDDGSWLRCLRRDNVELVRDEIVRVEPDAVVTARGRFEVDVIIVATGFRANEFLAPMKVTGRGGVELRERWADSPAAHLGITVPDFPNLFLMYGPGTNLAHAGSIIFHSECQMQFIGSCLRELLTGGHRSVEVTREAFDDYVERLQAELAGTVWAHPAVRHSWYKGKDGRVHVLSPWRLVDYWRMTHQVDPQSYLFT
ncbi:NAD(P)/FAD-dependent oxidoreductase [Frankia sp. AgB1.9]|uniref:flavin-containing monooxygenase n=1 Tax=unclassified Frankia TaxID=2632575 RepID=UPI0019317B58|nr:MULTISPECIES: NAD(P)/FAD-dependent oxidoreductase [unclassified Frankia]MBL7493127.1 NAD(P)/FAD-dependent oxidoreductase [Frankia sp. AgW1.1]MBL7551496.1 NAD(P)/FAD-dependent oxidoreductase [Frankia sp. AgB1.9]MBL7623607.1 NAD(P)/FAD-dependent oxidoreductase [Frankia sp. AgB1.8]